MQPKRHVDIAKLKIYTYMMSKWYIHYIYFAWHLPDQLKHAFTDIIALFGGLWVLTVLWEEFCIQKHPFECIYSHKKDYWYTKNALVHLVEKSISSYIFFYFVLWIHSVFYHNNMTLKKNENNYQHLTDVILVTTTYGMNQLSLKVQTCISFILKLSMFSKINQATSGNTRYCMHNRNSCRSFCSEGLQAP